jgi:hypothetical protein
VAESVVKVAGQLQCELLSFPFSFSLEWVNIKPIETQNEISASHSAGDEDGSFLRKDVF